MACPIYPDDATAEQYVSGTLAEPDQSAFEAHYFDCDACLARVQALQSLRGALASPAAVPVRRTGPWLAGLAIAASLVTAVAAWQYARRPAAAPLSATVVPTATPPAAEARPAALLALAVIVPPPYSPMVTRGPASEPRASFADAMEAYRAGRYPEAADQLAVVTTRTPDLPEAQFYLGVSALLAGRAAGAQSALARAAASGERPWSDEAHFYLGKAALALGDADGARREFSTAAAVSAGPDGEAARVLRALDALPR